MQHKTLIEGLESCGLLWCFYQLFGLSFWRHPFTAEDPLVNKWCKAQMYLYIGWKFALSLTIALKPMPFRLIRFRLTRNIEEKKKFLFLYSDCNGILFLNHKAYSQTTNEQLKIHENNWHGNHKNIFTNSLHFYTIWSNITRSLSWAVMRPTV